MLQECHSFSNICDTLPGLAVFHFLIWQVITSLYSAKSQAMALPILRFVKV
jgi:hypothetical protein